MIYLDQKLLVLFRIYVLGVPRCYLYELRQLINWEAIVESDVDLLGDETNDVKVNIDSLATYYYLCEGEHICIVNHDR